MMKRVETRIYRYWTCHWPIDLKSLGKFSGDSDWSGDEEDITERLKKKEGKSNIIVVVQCTVY